MENMKCWNRRMLQYVNNFRRKNGVLEMRISTKRIYQIAKKHSEAMEARGKVFHQNRTVVRRKIKCNS